MNYSTRKPFVVLAVTLALSLLLLIPGVPNTFVNKFGMVMGIIPLAVFLSIASSSKPWQTSSFLSGVALIVFGIGFFVLMKQLPELAKLAQQAGNLSSATAKEWAAGVDLWIYSIPVVSMAIGINLITAYIGSNPPGEG
jgi:general stress protein CsbA